MEMGQEGVRSWFGPDLGGINGFRYVTGEMLAGTPRPLVPLVLKSLEDEQPVLTTHIAAQKPDCKVADKQAAPDTPHLFDTP